MNDDGFDTPENAAMVGFPPKYCHVVVSRINGDDAYVLLNTGSSEHPYLYGVNCRRENGRWFEGSSSNGTGWSQSGPDLNLGTLTFWDLAPAEADAVRVKFDGRIVEEPVIGGAYLLVWWRVASPEEWPHVQAFRIAGHWIDNL